MFAVSFLGKKNLKYVYMLVVLNNNNNMFVLKKIKISIEHLTNYLLMIQAMCFKNL